MSQRSRKPPTLTRTLKGSLDQSLHVHIDAALKNLKPCARRLQPVLDMFSDELQILHQLYYKGKNQHRGALFLRRVEEMRRYGDRVEELSLLSLVDSLRYSFFAEELQPTPKLLKGSWTHYPDTASVSFVLERIGGALILVQKMHERLGHAYHLFTLAMQTGAFIQLILTLAGITSRMDNLVLELAAVLELTWAAIHRILLALKPGSPTQSIPSRWTAVDQSIPMNMSVEMPADVYEDTGVSVARQEEIRPETRVPNPNTAHAVICAPMLVDPVIERKVVVKRPPVAAVDPERRKSKKKRSQRDEIDDIFS